MMETDDEFKNKARILTRNLGDSKFCNIFDFMCNLQFLQESLAIAYRQIFLSRSYLTCLSVATIRNPKDKLEESGYLKKLDQSMDLIQEIQENLKNFIPDKMEVLMKG